MKKKELMALAKKIAELETKCSNSTDSQEIKNLKNEIMKLCHKVKSLEDIAILDELILKILEKKS